MKYLIYTFLFFSSVAFAKLNIERMTLREISYQVLDYSLKTQNQIVGHKYYLKGEWPTDIQSTLVPAIVGVGSMFTTQSEATAFTTASVINVLAQVYLENDNLKSDYPLNKIPLAIRDGIGSYSRYSDDSVFNFYPPLMMGNMQVRRPISMTLFPIWFGFTNIPNDADTTSSVYSSLIYNSKINGAGDFQVPSEALKQISQHRDVDRSPMFYNRFEGRRNTGGFMTWLIDENSKAMPRFYFADPKRGERIPFNKNDVDCVVNANVLKMLALAKEPNLEGRAEACALLNDMIRKDEHASCGVYYPNTLNLSFILATAEQAGETCISEKSHQLMIKKILAMQDGEGAWHNEKNIWQDPVLTTSFAMYSLLHYSNARDYKTYVALMYGAHYLLKNIQQKNNQIFWPADNFFTATAIARSLIMWRSSAYTNIVISSVLLKLDREFPQYRAQNYLQIKF